MITFSNCKINLGLRVLDKRPDGYHNIESIFYPIYWQDAIEIIQKDSKPSAETTIDTTGNSLDINPKDNICYKAYSILKKEFTELPPVHIHLHKTIPTGAGLGGGSANGAFTLMLLNKKFNLRLTEEELSAYALMLGSDCPFFINNKPCLASGRGEKLLPLALDLSAYKFIIVNPSIHVSTSWAFSQLHKKESSTSLQTIIQQPITAWKNELGNDFEDAIFETYPAIKELKKHLYSAGAVYASMSGSGSTVYGLFPKDVTPNMQLPLHYLVKEC
ncbi:MAG TPA: 4-(cytidine 5'-diphospho)-2-C-methyl-D-erythritol kinase [Chitinophagaceae bacterium]|nr:4-(cytidine 5'-diphospho)-2-C-methyl-D-erythritol kinase [Chitinophagaceae bacterium]